MLHLFSFSFCYGRVNWGCSSEFRCWVLLLDESGVFSVFSINKSGQQAVQISFSTSAHAACFFPPFMMQVGRMLRASPASYLSSPPRLLLPVVDAAAIVFVFGTLFLSGLTKGVKRCRRSKRNYGICRAWENDLCADFYRSPRDEHHTIRGRH